jgi:hypothetical protein
MLRVTERTDFGTPRRFIERPRMVANRPAGYTPEADVRRSRKERQICPKPSCSEWLARSVRRLPSRHE